MSHKLGAHVSISGGYTGALEKINKMGGSCLQIFSSSPRGWSFARPTDEQIESFKTVKADLSIDPIYFHASYLINLGDPDRTGKLSKQSLKHELKLAAKFGVKGSIIHLGSFKSGDDTVDDTKYSVLIENISEILQDIPKESLFIIENAGTRKIGRTLEEIARIISAVKDYRVRVCLDTCHLHAAGYDIRDEKKLDSFLQTFETLIGLEKLELWHVNDSKDPFGSLRDRHDNIGKGTVGIDTFKLLLNNPKTKNRAFIIETPGFDEKGPDKENLDILKSLITS